MKHVLMIAVMMVSGSVYAASSPACSAQSKARLGDNTAAASEVVKSGTGSKGTTGGKRGQR